jgi:hypothetical protein
LRLDRRVEFLKPSELRARQPSICSHHGAIASVRGSLVLLRQMRTISSAPAAIADDRQVDPRTFLLIDEGSISTWIFVEPGENASMRPVMRSSKRAPILIIRSQSCIAMLAS